MRGRNDFWFLSDIVLKNPTFLRASARAGASCVVTDRKIQRHEAICLMNNTSVETVVKAARGRLQPLRVVFPRQPIGRAGPAPREPWPQLEREPGPAVHACSRGEGSHLEGVSSLLLNRSLSIFHRAGRLSEMCFRSVLRMKNVGSFFL